MADNPTNQYEGTSNPPGGGQILDISNPEANDATLPVAQAANQPPTPSSPSPSAEGDSGGEQPQQQQPQAQVQAPQGPQAQAQGPQPNLAKAPTPQAPAGPPPPAQNPAVQKASVFHDIAETLGGGI